MNQDRRASSWESRPSWKSIRVSVRRLPVSKWRRHAFASAGRRKQRKKDRIFQRISKDILRMQAEEEKMLELQIELANEEAEEKRIQADRAALEKRLRDRMEMMAANEYQRKLRLERQRQQESEEDFRRRMMDKIAEDERIEQMNGQKRRMKMMEHKREVVRLLEEQREEERRAQALRSLIEEERKEILAEAAGKLGLACMPRGVLSSKEDLEMFKAMGAKQIF